jgi:hypothetical protein
MTASCKPSPETKSQLAIGKMFASQIIAVAGMMDAPRANAFIRDIVRELTEWLKRTKPLPPLDTPPGK